MILIPHSINITRIWFVVITASLRCASGVRVPGFIHRKALYFLPSVPQQILENGDAILSLFKDDQTKVNAILQNKSLSMEHKKLCHKAFKRLICEYSDWTEAAGSVPAPNTRKNSKTFDGNALNGSHTSVTVWHGSLADNRATLY